MVPCAPATAEAEEDAECGATDNTPLGEDGELLPIKLYTFDTPNGWKVNLTLAFLGLSYETIPVNISANEHKSEWFLEINPNGRVPAIVDPNLDDYAVFESGAIMVYLCDRYDLEGDILPRGSEEVKERSTVLQWLMFQMAGLGPIQGQANHYVTMETLPYARDRYLQETHRLYHVLDTQLSKTRYICRDDRITIADLSIWPWVAFSFVLDIPLEQTFPNVARWFEEVGKHPIVAQECGEKLKRMKGLMAGEADIPTAWRPKYACQ